MKKVEAIIKPFKLNSVKEALDRTGIEEFTISKVKGVGRQKGLPDVYRGHKFIVDFLPKLKIELLVNDYKAAQIVEAIRKAARTGQVGDGKAYVLSVDSHVSMDDEHGSRAI